MQKGDVVEATITVIKPYGAFVKIDDNTDGLVHISEVSHQYVHQIEDYLTVGQTYKFMVLDDVEKSKVRLSYKRMQARKKRLTIHLKVGFKPLKKALSTWIESYDQKRSNEDE